MLQGCAIGSRRINIQTDAAKLRSRLYTAQLLRAANGHVEKGRIEGAVVWEREMQLGYMAPRLTQRLPSTRLHIRRRSSTRSNIAGPRGDSIRSNITGPRGEQLVQACSSGAVQPSQDAAPAQDHDDPAGQQPAVLEDEQVLRGWQGRRGVAKTTARVMPETAAVASLGPGRAGRGAGVLRARLCWVGPPSATAGPPIHTSWQQPCQNGMTCTTHLQGVPERKVWYVGQQQAVPASHALQQAARSMRHKTQISSSRPSLPATHSSRLHAARGTRHRSCRRCHIDRGHGRLALHDDDC
jgi:hypothetical protein